jgi:hypothetical protein
VLEFYPAWPVNLHVARKQSIRFRVV